jgi:hypothetical protein
MSETRTEYKIRRKSDGWLSTGGVSPRFNKRGKTWRTVGALNAHINLACRLGGYGRWHEQPADSCEIVQYTITVVELPAAMPLAPLISDATIRHSQREHQRAQAALRARQTQLEQELTRVRSALGETEE